MASELKRKRGPVEVTETLKRAKSENLPAENSPKSNILLPSGWDAAFNPPPEVKELIKTNGTNDDDAVEEEEPKEGSPEAVDFEVFTEEGREFLRKKKLELREEQRLRREVLKQKAATWTISEPIGGRMLNADPVFTEDQEFLILANNTTINVYSTSTSLLTRAIRPQIDYRARPTARIIAYCLSCTSSNLLWVACSDGAIYCIDWTSGAGADQYWGISSTGCIHMTVASMTSAGRQRDVVFTTELRKDGGWRITANELAPPNGPIQTVARTIYSSPKRIHFLKTASKGAIMVAAAENRVIIGALKSTEFDTIDKIKYEFRIFESSDIIFSLDVRVSEREEDELQGKKLGGKRKMLPIVDVVVGDVKGAIFLHSDLWANLSNPQNGAPGISLVPRKLHWHRQAVHTVKWSKDGNYIISGGTESVLVLWQLETGKMQYLPYLGSTIQNVVISPSGTSYGVQLADNSTMVLSVTELLPTANIAGVQSSVLSYEHLIKSVRRVGDESQNINLVQRTPAIISPSDPSKLLLGVGQLQEINHSKPVITSIPFLQTFDLASGHNISRQSLTRTNITGRKEAPNAHSIAEPRVTHMKLSFDGAWLATVEEWAPPKQDFEFIGYRGIGLEEEQRNRREVFLKFWNWSAEQQTWELVSRINEPHAFEDSTGTPRILDLASDPTTLRFSTIGEDGIVRTWTPKIRKRDGIILRAKDNIPLRNWTCARAITLSKPAPENFDRTIPNGAVAFSEDGSLLAAASSSSNGLLHLLDPELGTVRQTRTRMYDGPIIALSFLGQDLITLSNRIQVYDLILDNLRYSLRFQPRITSLSIAQKREMMHLATDPASCTFAVAVPGSVGSFNFTNHAARKRGSLDSFFSEVAVFSQQKREPVLQEAFSSIVTALIGAGDGGYLVLDSQAEIRILLKKGKQAVTTAAQSTAALNLDDATKNLDASIPVEEEVEDEEDEEDEEIETPMLEGGSDKESGAEDEDEVEEEEEVDDDDDDENPVITQQQLTEIFDIGPSFAMPPIEELFMQVANLVSGPPLPIRVKPTS